MKFTWTEVATRYKFDDRQTILGEYLVNRGKDALLEVWAAGSEEGPAPVEYAAELAAKTVAGDDPETGRLVMEYLKTKKKRGAASSYLQLQYETEQSVVKDVFRLLQPDQAAGFKNLEIGSLLLDVDTGHRPLDDRIGVLTHQLRHPGEPGPAEPPRVADGDWSLSMTPLLRMNGVTEHLAVDLQQVCTALSLDSRQSTLLTYLLDWLHNQCAELWSTVTDDYGRSPLEFIVDVKLRGDGGPIERPLVDYLRTARKLGTDRTYYELQAQLECALQHELNRTLGRDVTAPLHALGVGSFLSIATGNEPIADRLSTLHEENKLKNGIDLFCSMPFEYVHIEDTGDVLPCCPSKFRLSIGNLKSDSMQDVWSSRAAVAVRESIIDKSFRFCNYHACEYLKEGRNKHASK